MSKYPQVECCKVVIERRGDDMTYVAKADDWLSLLDDAAAGAILHSCATELSELADTFAPGYGDSVEATLPPVETQTASAIARRRGNRTPFRLLPGEPTDPTDGGDDGDAA